MSIDFKRIQEAVEARDAFLKENPQLLPLQKKIQEVLNKAGPNKHNRQAALQELMLNTWFQILEVWDRKGE